jgi:putative protease
MTRIELTAPAKDAETGMTAIDCGADAVYIGPRSFGAREGAGNSTKDVARLAAYAHRYYARVYATLNTILRDEELPEALQLARELYEAGVDGLIVQDVGLLELELPPLPLIASTQMHNNTPEKALFWEQVGFQRVILARELTLAEIREIRRKTTIELECFVHGALCVSQSGQCYMSYAIGGRSGNRGACAQPCRRPYSLRDSRGRTLQHKRYLLSLKDLNLSEHLAALLEAGVTAFKIEGRLKDRSYVANIVGFYREKLDSLLDGRRFAKSSSGSVALHFSPDPYKTFNRGYTDYGITSHRQEMASMDTPKSMGERIGTVARVGKEYFTLDTEHTLHSGDGLCFFDEAHSLSGTVVNRVHGGKVYPDKMAQITEGTVVFRNHDHLFVRQLESDPAERRVRPQLTLRECPEGLTLSAVDEDGIRAAFSSPVVKKAAEKPDLARATMERQLSKLGHTEFACESVAIELPVPYFVPVSFLNGLRREAIRRLVEERERNRPRPTGAAITNEVPYPEKALAYTGNVLNRKAEAFYRRHGVTSIEAAAESGLDMNGRVVMRTKHCLKEELGLCGKDRAAEGIEEPLYLVDEDGRTYLLEFTCEDCSMVVYFGSSPGAGRM